MVPLAKGASYAENDKAMDIDKGVLAGPLKVDFTRSFYDTTQCAAFTELVAATDPHPYVIHTRMEATEEREGDEDGVGGDGRGGLGVRRGRAPCRHADREVGRDPQGQARHASRHPGGGRRVPEQLGRTRSSRCRMARPAPGSKAASTRAPGTRRRNTCDMGAFPQKLNVTNRRYVIDENVGAVAIFHNFPWLDASQPSRPGNPGQPDVPGRGRQESLHPRGDGLQGAWLWEREAAGSAGSSTGRTGTGGTCGTDGNQMTTSTGVVAALRPLRSSLIAAIVGITLLLPTAHGAAAPGKTPDIFGVWLAISSNSANHDPQWANKPYAPTPEFTRLGCGAVPAAGTAGCRAAHARRVRAHQPCELRRRILPDPDPAGA